MLTEINREIFHAEYRYEAIGICCNNPDINLILMDIKMPKINGNDATRQMRKFNIDVIIIAQSTYGLIEDREKVMEAGCNEHLSKSIMKEDFFH